MTTFGWFLVAVGALIIATRGPLLVAPQSTRALYMRIIESDASMRVWSIFAVVLGALSVLLSTTATGLAAAIAYWLGLAIVVLAFGGSLFFPAQLRQVGDRVWKSFSGPVLRLLGLLSVAVGAFLVWYGAQL